MEYEDLSRRLKGTEGAEENLLSSSVLSVCPVPL